MQKFWPENLECTTTWRT